MNEKLQYKIDNFEGPLDLLLFLILKNKLNIYDINISKLLDQYTESIKDFEEESMDNISDFLEMATRLVYIKTAMLLPKYEDEGEKLKAELQGELIEYQSCKRIAQELREHFCGDDIFSRDAAPVSVDCTYTRIHQPIVVLNAYLSALGRRQRKLPPPVNSFSAVVHKSFVSVSSRAIILLKKLYRSTKIKWNDLFIKHSKSENVAMFLALLELVKTGRINVDDKNMISMGKNTGRNHRKAEN